MSILFETNHPSVPAVAFAILGLVAYGLLRVLSDPLRKVPGPWLARWTRLWEFQKVREGHMEQVNLDLHKQYGPVVRTAPNRYSIADPSILSQVYAHANAFQKSEYYRAWGHPEDDKSDLFSMVNEAHHAANRRKVAAMYSMSSLVSYEPYVDANGDTLIRHFESMAKRGESIDLPSWMQYYAFDVIGDITFGQPFGMMHAGGDVEDIFHAIHASLHYSSHVGLWADIRTLINGVRAIFGYTLPTFNLFAYAGRHLAARRAAPPDDERADFAAKLIAAHKAGKVEEIDVFTTVLANIAAGSDTTAISLSAIVWHLERHPQAKAKLRAEIADMAAKGQVSDPVTFAEAQHMPYLQAVIKETLRMHPAVGMMLPRVVPPEGARLAGWWFPGGSIVGANAWVIHRDQGIFGADADTFRPERWLGSKEEIAPMERNSFAFGGGARTCIGRNISMLEMTKLIPELYRRFDFQLEEGDMETENIFFVTQKFKARVVPREKTTGI